MNALALNKLYNQIPLKILSFISVYPAEMFSSKEIESGTNSSKGATNQALRLLDSLNIVSREKRGNIFLYKLNSTNVVLKHFKIFETLFTLQDLVKALQPYCYQIILYGSCADGSNTEDSDIDIFIQTNHKKKVSAIINRYKSEKNNIQTVLLDPLEIVSSKKEDKAFYEQVKKGIVLWEGKPEYEEL